MMKLFTLGGCSDWCLIAPGHVMAVWAGCQFT